MTSIDLSFWRDLALILLAVEATLAGLIPLVLLVLAIRTLRWTNGQVRRYGRWGRDRWRRVHENVVQVDRWVRHPLRFRSSPTLSAHREET